MTEFRLGFILLLIFGSITIYGYSPIMGYVLFQGWKVIDWTKDASQTPKALLPIYITIPSSILSVIGFILFFTTNEKPNKNEVSKT